MVLKGTADSKLRKFEVANYCLSIGGFQELEVFLAKHGEMRNRNDGFIGLLIVNNPFPKGETEGKQKLQATTAEDTRSPQPDS